MVTPKVQEPKQSKWARPKPHNPVTVVMDAARDTAGEGQDQVCVCWVGGGGGTAHARAATPACTYTHAA